MNRTDNFLRIRFGLAAILALLLIWLASGYEIYRTRGATIREAEARTTIESQVFAEYSRSTLKRVNEFILDLRSRWTGDWYSFAQIVQGTQANIDDITFQIAVIGKDGLVAFTNLAPPTERTDLSDREHFRVHRDAGNADRLFISSPLIGKVSGKWSLQITRPVLKDGQFNGVIVVSLSPDEFSDYAETLRIGKTDTLAMIRDNGEILSRYPNREGAIGTVVKDSPYLTPGSPVSGSYRLSSSIDGIDRIYGYYHVPEFGLNFVVGEDVEQVLAPYRSYRSTVVVAAVILSILTITLLFLLFRSLISLEETRLRQREIFLLSPDGFVSFDANGLLKEASPAFSKITGLNDNDLVGLSREAFTARLAANCASHARLVFHAGAPRARDADMDPDQVIELVSPHTRTLEVVTRRSDARSTSEILYFRDVTHKAEIDRMKSEFLSTAAHELRTPMASIYGFSELLLAKDFDEKIRKELLNTIYTQSGIMATIINELLDLARIEARRGKDFNLEPVKLSALADEAVAGFKPSDGRSVSVELPPVHEPFVNADRGKIKQAISNLLSNAFKYSPVGSPVSIRCRVELDGNRQMVGIEVQDRGIGMTQEQKDRIFERFYRADSSGSVPGTGLGMSIVKEIIDIHRGRVDVQSSLGLGTTASLWLPA